VPCILALQRGLQSSPPQPTGGEGRFEPDAGQGEEAQAEEDTLPLTQEEMAVAEVAEEAEKGASLPGGGGSMSVGSPPLLCLSLQLDQRKAAVLLGLLLKRLQRHGGPSRRLSLWLYAAMAALDADIIDADTASLLRALVRSCNPNDRTSEPEPPNPNPDPNPDLNSDPNPNPNQVRSCMALRAKLVRKVAVAAAVAAAVRSEGRGDGSDGGGGGGGAAAAAAALAAQRAAALNVLLGLAGGFFGQASTDELILTLTLTLTLTPTPTLTLTFALTQTLALTLTPTLTLTLTSTRPQ
jgi:hypothetical protein